MSEEPKATACLSPLHGFITGADVPLFVRSKKWFAYPEKFYYRSVLRQFHDDPEKIEKRINYDRQFLREVDGQDCFVVYCDIPCGKCLNCKLNYARRWSVRCRLEMEDCANKALFLTLTYSDEHLTFENGVVVLNYSDFQNFMKRLRYYLGAESVRYFACGEYGPKTFRPHYHAILFGVDWCDFAPWRQWCDMSHGHESITYISDKLNDIWKLGRVNVGFADMSAINYVARYVVKPVDFYEDYVFNPAAEIVPEKLLYSRRPGIGMRSLEKYGEQLATPVRLVIASGDGRALPFTPPRSMRDYLERKGFRPLSRTVYEMPVSLYDDADNDRKEELRNSYRRKRMSQLTQLKR